MLRAYRAQWWGQAVPRAAEEAAAAAAAHHVAGTPPGPSSQGVWHQLQLQAATSKQPGKMLLCHVLSVC
jgi:hypothetical protein